MKGKFVMVDGCWLNIIASIFAIRSHQNTIRTIHRQTSRVDKVCFKRLLCHFCALHTAAILSLHVVDSKFNVLCTDGLIEH